MVIFLMVEINVKKCGYPCIAMVQYYKKTNENGELVQLLMCDQSNPKNIYGFDSWYLGDEDFFEVDKMQEITMEEYRKHHIRLKLGAIYDPVKPYQHGDERGIFRMDDFEKE